MRTTQRIAIDGTELEVDVRGEGETVVFVHGGCVADTFLPLMAEPALAGHRLVRYRRRGYGGRARELSAPLPVAGHAADCAALLSALGAPAAHVVGHSFGGSVALQLAVDAPDRVLSLTLLEPAGLPVPARAGFTAAVRELLTRYRAGDAEGAAAAFMAAVGGPAWREELRRSGPHGPEQAGADAAALFEHDVPAIAAWEFGPDTAAAIRSPVLYLYGTRTLPVIVETRDLLRAWLPRMEVVELAGLNHFLHVQRPAEVAGVLAGFVAAHTRAAS